MRSTRQAEPQKKNRLGLPECLSSCFFKAKPCTALLLRTPLTALWRVSVSRAPQQDRRASELACCRHRTDGQDEWETHRRERWPSGWRRRWLVSRDLVALRGLRGEAAARTARRRLRFSVVREIPLCDGPLASPSLRCASRLPGVNFSRMPLCVAVVRCEECEASRAWEILAIFSPFSPWAKSVDFSRQHPSK